jgi:hypothetical protein
MTRRISVIFWDVCFFPAAGHRRRNDDPQGRQADPRGGRGRGGHVIPFQIYSLEAIQWAS